MFLFKKNFYFYLYIFFLILALIFNKFSTNYAFSKNFIITGVEIEENYDLNFDKSKVIDKGFREAFNILTYKILEKKDKNKLKKISLIEIKGLIDNFSIVDEKFIDNKYKSQFEVQFNRKKIINFIDNQNLISSLPKKIETFLLPIMLDTKKNELLYLNQNFFYKNWNNISKNYFLIDYILPNEDIEDYLIIKKNINNIENYSFEEIIRKYEMDNFIILIVLKSDNQLRSYSKIKFGKKNMLINKYYNNININDQEVLNNLILELKENFEDKWKSINKLNTSMSLPIRLVIDSKNLILSQKLEKILLENDLVSGFVIEKFNNNQIVYKILFSSSPDKFIENMLFFDFKIDTSNELWKLNE